ncbi:MAG TPA: FG-GAP-like repeat-containing protein [Candidatus Sulfotelmatobacter sp.]|nr:FG-GAP-like repeat-containing protein [Candidatus Sulfotelmatobacter sp.]
MLAARIPRALFPVSLAVAILVLSSGFSVAAAPNQTNLLSAPVVLYPNTPGWYGWGYSVSAVGDVNGDGYADFAVTTAYASPFGTYAAAIYYGSATGPVSPPGWIRTAFTHPVHVAPAGDVNGDGYDDVVFGAADTTTSGVGVVEVWYGGSGGLGVSPSVALTGDYSFGWSVCTAGDVNGDGYDDLLVGDPLAVGLALGSASLYYGSATGLSTSPAWSTSGAYLYERLGMSVAGVGDLDGDGFADFGIGSQAGEIGVLQSPGQIYHGSLAGPAAWTAVNGVDAAFFAPAGDVAGDGQGHYFFADPYFSGTASLPNIGAAFISGSNYSAYGANPGAHFGLIAITAGDVNGDGVADALVMSDPTQLDLVYGHRLGQLATVQAIYPPGAGNPGDFSACAAGDVNGDGFGDIVIGIPAASDFGARAGEILFYKGQADPPRKLAERFGGQTSAVAGWSMAIGDVNGDGFDDVLVGEPLFDSGILTDNGRVELYLGGEAGMAGSSVWSSAGQLNGAGAGISVAMGQDINGDGIGDLVVGLNHSGQVYAWYGHADWSTAGGTPDQVLSGATGSMFGSSVAFAGDVNGDGYADVLVGAPSETTYTGAPHAIVAHPQAGMAFLYLGSPGGLTFSGWSETDNQNNAGEATCVASAGDVNADGYSDILVGTGTWDGSFVDEGHAKLYLGGPSGPSSTPQRTWTGVAAGDHFGQALAGIGDFDGDGYGDIAIGAYGAGGTGKVYAYRGDPSGVLATSSWTLTGSSANAAFGNSVSAAGDVNGDGYSDLAVGEVFGDGAGGTDCGHVYIFAGGPDPLASPYITFEGTGNADNLGQSVAGGGDINGDGFADVVAGEPRRLSSFFDEGGFQLYLGNSRGLTNEAGRGRPTRAMQPGPPADPIAVYGRSRSASSFGLTSNAASAGGRDRVALDWRVMRKIGGGSGLQGRTAWKLMGAPTDPLEGAALVSQSVTGLTASTVYGWKTRVLSHSPWFRYGSWFTPQANGPLEWDVRTAPSNTDVSAAAMPPTKIELSEARPNPSRGGVRMDFALPERGHARVQVRDVQGRLVQTLEDRDLEAGRHSLSWNGADAAGRAAAAGLYFIELSASNERVARRVVRLR